MKVGVAVGRGEFGRVARGVTIMRVEWAAGWTGVFPPWDEGAGVGVSVGRGVGVLVGEGGVSRRRNARVWAKASSTRGRTSSGTRSRREASSPSARFNRSQRAHCMRRFSAGGRCSYASRAVESSAIYASNNSGSTMP